MNDADKKGNKSFGKSVRLRGRTNFLVTVKGESSRKIQGKHCRISFTLSPDGSTGFGITVSRKVGGAVRRNRLKRVIREYLRNNKPLWPMGKMVVILISNPVANETELTSEIGKMLKGINE